MTGQVDLSIDDGLASLVLRRPAKRNAIDPHMAQTILEHLAAVASSEARAMLLSAEGASFCAGRDVNAAWGDRGAEQLLAEVFNPMVAAIDALAIPTVAAVQGHCLGAGLGLALACDLVVVGDDAVIGSPFARRGTVADSGAHLLLLERVGLSRTLELLYTGRMLNGDEAAQWGAANLCVPRDDLEREATALARSLAAGPTAAFRESKALLRTLSGRPGRLAEALAGEAAAQERMFASADYREAQTARAEQRAPRFRGR